jgi:SAM-dependent methyltransferase
MLANASNLHALSPEAWLSLGQRLEAIGLAADPAAAVVRMGARRNYARRSPSAKWNARRSKAPWAAAARMLVLRDPVSEAEARAALGDIPLGGLLEAGLLERAEGGVVSPFVTRVAGGRFFVCDDLSEAGDAVMGVSSSTLLSIRASMPLERVRSALDLGCGAGTVAIALAPRCDRVVATDVSERAIAVAWVNAWINGVTNVEFRKGDLFQPAGAEAFDLVVSQPPFVARPEGETGAVYLFGGSRGDELALRLLRELPAHLAPGGTAVLRIDWPVADADAPIDERLRAAVGAPDASVLAVGFLEEDLDDYCENYARLHCPELDATWERLAMQRRDHLARMALTGIHKTLTIVRRCADGAPGWTAAVQSEAVRHTQISPANVAALLAERDLVARGHEALGARRMRIAPGTVFETAMGMVLVRFAEGSVHAPTVTDEATVELLRLVDAAETAGRAAADRASAAGVPQQATLDAVAAALLSGMLVLA